MTIRRAPLALAATAAALVLSSGCAIMRGPEAIGATFDDSAITTQVKARMVEDRNVDANANAIHVQTLNGEVMLSGFARNPLEKSAAESIAMKVRGVKVIRNEIAVRP